ncbi:hypothetical protein PRK78_003876 [Emydomyces testavorans]|uniref:MMS19 nucleotide excision repair protein n=1 Tax=Emydomyces testavorans TaxID=2070801 RepID=A0AAF0IIR7_9EURO|nr:hypothetical protein PRK78_003876 [Emydomyces testavorans]
MKDESLVGIVEIVDGERDPRNLMLVFSILRVVMIEWDISNHAQTLFDSVYKYFPVTFRLHPNDPYKITAQDLKDRLQDCISSNQAFAPYAIPSLLDKLDSTSVNVKKDALSALGVCVSSYACSILAQYSLTIWDSLRFEILNAHDDVLVEESLRVIQLLSKRLSSPALRTDKQLWLAQFLKPILAECNEQLREPQQKQAKPAQRILTSVSAVSSASFTLISQAVVPRLLSGYRNASEIPKQRSFLDVLVGLVSSAITVFGTWMTVGPNQTSDNPLSAFKDQLIESFSQALMKTGKDEVPIRMVALQGILQLSILRDFLQDNEIGLYVQYFGNLLLNEQSTGNQLREKAVNALSEISKYKPALLIKITIPALMTNLPGSIGDADHKYLITLEDLARISVDKDVFYALVTQLLDRLDSALIPGNPSIPEYLRSILMTILYAMDHKGLEDDPHLELYYDRIVRNLCRQAIIVVTKDNKPSPLSDPTILDILGRLCNLIVRSLPPHMHQEVRDNVYRLYSDQVPFTTVPSYRSSTGSQRRSMILSTYLLAGLPRDIALTQTTSDMARLLAEIVQFAVSEDSPPVQFALVRQLALLINKFLLISDSRIAADILFSLMPSSQENRKITSQVIRTIFWMSKALILRLAPTTTQILSSLVELVASSDPLVKETSAKGFRLLLSADDVLSPANGVNIRLLAKQRAFTTLIPLISERVCVLNTASPGNATALSQRYQEKQAYLTALSGILSTTPPSLIMPELQTLLPLLLQSLDLTGIDFQPMQMGTLETLSIIIRESGVEAIDEIGYVEDLVTRLLQAAAPTTDVQKGANNKSNYNTPQVRQQAVLCLLLLAQPRAVDGDTINVTGNAKPSPLLPLKNRVLKSLKLILDDPKRNVRKSAVDAHVMWLKLGGAELQNDD